MIHSTFSPAGMPADLLESTFVQRQGLAERLIELFVESARTESKHHVLLVGPRGIGKSHLACLVYHRLLKKPQLKGKLAIAYLREDEWGITSFMDLLFRILRELGVAPRELQGLAPKAAEDRAWNALLESVRGRTLLVILENLDTILRSLGEEGQRKWRARMQDHPFWALLATTPSLSEDISDHASPFYGFFEIQPLEGLNVQDAVTLLRRLADSQRRPDIAEYVSSPRGRARVRAVQHLANGNHRVFVIFYEFLTRDKEADLVEPVLKAVDALTPYYQSQMKELSPQQRKLVEFLCQFRSAANVKTIASACFVSHQTAASQLKQLLESRYLRVTRIGRESYYELHEPLLRICVEAKSRSGAPIRLMVEFLRYWFAREELEQKVSTMKAGVPERVYFVAALNEYESSEGHDHLSPDVGRLCRALTIAVLSGDKAAITATALELAQVSKIAEDWIHFTRALSFAEDFTGAIETLREAVRNHPENNRTLLALARALDTTGRRQEALSLCERVLTVDPRMALAWIDKGQILQELGRDDEALEAYTRASDLDPDWSAPAWEHASLLLRMKKYAEAQHLLLPFVKRKTCHPRIMLVYGASLASQGRIKVAHRYFTKVLKQFPRYLAALALQGEVLIELNRPQEALDALEKALLIAPKDDHAQFLFCKALFAAGQHQRSLSELPVEIVAHRVFHELLELANRDSNKVEIEKKLRRFHSVFGKPPGSEALAGGLTELASHMHRHGEAYEVGLLNKWHEVASRLFASDPRLEIIIKMFDVMVRFKDSHDQRVLLELPLEQRRLLEHSEPTTGEVATSGKNPSTQ